MIDAEDVLAAIAGRTLWLETGVADRRDPRHRQYHAVVQRLEREFDLLRKELPSGARLPVDLPSALGSGTYSRRASAGIQELVADATQKMPRAHLNAVLFACAHDPAAQRDLEERLIRKARKSQQRDGFWPARIRRRKTKEGITPTDDYALDLVTLALMELLHPGEFGPVIVKADWFGISREYWYPTVAKPYAVLQQTTAIWFGEGCAHICERLRRRARHYQEAS